MQFDTEFLQQTYNPSKIYCQNFNFSCIIVINTSKKFLDFIHNIILNFKQDM